MDVPDFDGSRTSSRSTVIDSIRGCGMPIFGTPKRDLRQKIMMPQYLRLAMRDAIESKDVAAGDSHFASASSVGEVIPPSEAPLVVFINSRSGGRHGPEVKSRLQDLTGEEQVFDLQFVRPHEFVQHGLGCLERLADLGDLCAEKTREKLRIVVAGGDGTVGWVLGCLGELHKQRREPVPPTAIIPLGTGNDLSRSFGWGGSFPFNWKSAIKRTLDKASAAPISRLDSWKISVSMPSGEIEDPPHCLRSLEECSLDQILDSLSNFKCGCNTPVIKTLYISEQLMDLEDNGVQTERELPEKVQTEGELPEKVSQYEGVFYNYFSIGMDAQIAYGFHHLRNEKPHLAQGPIANKLIYSGYGCTQGWFFTQCMSDPGLRGLKNIVRLYIKKVNCSDWEQVSIPSSVRSIVALNLNSYASGRNPWGNLKPEYLEKRGFVEAQVDDGLLEIFGLKQGWHASFVMTELISAKHIAQAAMIRFELRGGEWKEAYLQIDGEPWKQPMNNFRSTFIEIGRVPFQSVMIDGNGE